VFVLECFVPGLLVTGGGGGGGRGGIGTWPPFSCALSNEGMAMPMRMAVDSVLMMGVFFVFGWSDSQLRLSRDTPPSWLCDVDPVIRVSLRTLPTYKDNLKRR